MRHSPGHIRQQVVLSVPTFRPLTDTPRSRDDSPSPRSGDQNRPARASGQRRLRWAPRAEVRAVSPARPRVRLRTAPGVPAPTARERRSADAGHTGRGATASTQRAGTDTGCSTRAAERETPGPAGLVHTEGRAGEPAGAGSAGRGGDGAALGSGGNTASPRAPHTVTARAAGHATYVSLKHLVHRQGTKTLLRTRDARLVSSRAPARSKAS